MATKVKATQKVIYVKPDIKESFNQVEKKYKNFSKFIYAVLQLFKDDQEFRTKIDDYYKQL